jgi:ATP-dependent RNA helicase DHX8/PRP22
MHVCRAPSDKFTHEKQLLMLCPTFNRILLATIICCAQVMSIDPKWLVELAPRFFKPADPNRLSRRKRYERIEPLYDKYHDPVAWRLSKRRG